MFLGSKLFPFQNGFFVRILETSETARKGLSILVLRDV
jgi:hypothetical protein